MINELDDSIGAPAPCQPIGCDNGIHLPGCYYARVDSAEEIARSYAAQADSDVNSVAEETARAVFAELTGGDVLDVTRAKTVIQLDGAGSVFVPDDALAGLPDGSITIDPALDMPEPDDGTHTCAEQAAHYSGPQMAVLGLRPYVLIEYTVDGDGHRGVGVRFGGSISCKHQARWVLIETLHTMGHDRDLGPLDDEMLAFVSGITCPDHPED